MNNKLKSVYVILFLFVLVACSDQQEEPLVLEPFELAIIDSLYFYLPPEATIISDKDIYQLKDSVDLTLIIVPPILFVGKASYIS